ncbi:hypothetical protein Gdia_0569 [Gluconacetobacter diazotrophicus PA1 5]|uniref:baseplate megatron protein TIM-barrel domain-containing protein n=1 Tax=Gluconacetobacter diazotrophicus TaxID=33996 RepID=UPI000181EFB2|nr:glycoside hydrolase TIM-barrel-like domain-containing protein [Gluconacetobacter diazotrophicus]ACI50361.1 hypothetical protein Gdia_0569 [Gluconacetobacter diazotrophicus PA1 5]
MGAWADSVVKDIQSIQVCGDLQEVEAEIKNILSAQEAALQQMITSLESYLPLLSLPGADPVSIVNWLKQLILGTVNPYIVAFQSAMNTIDGVAGDVSEISEAIASKIAELGSCTSSFDAAALVISAEILSAAQASLTDAQNQISSIEASIASEPTGGSSPATTLNDVAADLSVLTENVLSCEATKYADTLMITVFNEFDLDTEVQISTYDTPFNGTIDFYIKNIEAGSCSANFPYMVKNDLSHLPNIETLMIWTQWFSLCPDSTGNNPGLVQPAINSTIAAELSSVSQWFAGGIYASSAVKLNGTAGGTANDASMIRGMQYLVSRGYNVGFAPIVLGWNNAQGLSDSAALIWRGYFTWTETSDFQSWMTSYIAFNQYYIDLFQTNGVIPTRWAVGSEFADLTTNAPPDQWGIFVQGLQSIASSVRAAFPNCTITYAANYTDYGVGGGFRCDALWSHPDIDEVGIDWYFPLTTDVSASPSDIRGGLVAGEDIDYTYNLSDGSQRTITGSKGVGKTLETQIPIAASAGIKNVKVFWEGCHYVSKASGFMAGATSLAGYGPDFDPYGLPGLTGTAAPVVAPGLTAPGVSGQQITPRDTDTYLPTDGKSTYGTFQTPTFTPASLQTQWTLDTMLQVMTIPSQNYARLFECAGVFELMIDTSSGGGFKIGIGPSSNEFFITLGEVDNNIHNLSVSFTPSTYSLTIVWDGVSSQYTVSSASVMEIPSDTSVYLGGYNTNTNLVAANFYTFGMTFIQDGITYGGTFHFDEAYAGTRTSWVPKMKVLSATELGFASISGTSVEPNEFPYADLGSPTIAVPATLNSITQSLYNSFISKGWNPTEVYAAYGCSFNYAPDEQAYALNETLKRLQVLRNNGAFSAITLYNMDARPAQAMTILVNDKIYYTDAPLAVFNHSLGGKLAGGSTFFDQKIIQNGSIF